MTKNFNLLRKYFSGNLLGAGDEIHENLSICTVITIIYDFLNQ